MPRKDLFDASFAQGEKAAMDLTKEIIVEVIKGKTGKGEVKATLRAFSGWTAGYISCLLFQTYMEMIRLLRESNEDETLAEFWCQKVVTTFGQAVANEGVPVQLQFAIKREEKKT